MEGQCNETDGTVETAVADVSQELGKLRQIAHDLRILNANSINWTLFVAVNSDSAAAATQKKLNQLIEERRISDEKLFGSANLATVDIIESVCSMHIPSCKPSKSIFDWYCLLLIYCRQVPSCRYICTPVL